MSDNKETYRPEDDLQELWMLNGRVEALRGMIMAKMQNDIGALFYARDICAVIGWKYEQ